MAEIENVQLFTSMMRDANRLNLPGELKQKILSDIEDAKRASQKEPPTP
jgi:hypothetical protein